MFRFSSLMILYGLKYKSWLGISKSKCETPVLMNLNIINDYSSYCIPIEQPIEIVVEEDLSKKMIKLTGDSSRLLKLHLDPQNGTKKR